MDQDEITAALNKLTDSVNGAVKQAAVNCTKLEQHEKMLESIEQHCRRINGTIGTHTDSIGKHDTRITLLEAQGEPAKRKAVDWPSDWWKFAMVIGSVAAGSVVEIISRYA